MSALLDHLFSDEALAAFNSVVLLVNTYLTKKAAKRAKQSRDVLLNGTPSNVRRHQTFPPIRG